MSTTGDLNPDANRISIELLMHITDERRLARALELNEEDFTIFNIQVSPHFVISASCIGTTGDLYRIEIDTGNNYFYHNCPDFAKRQPFCKHLAKLALLLPEAAVPLMIQAYHDCERTFNDSPELVVKKLPDLADRDPSGIPISPDQAIIQKMASYFANCTFSFPLREFLIAIMGKWAIEFPRFFIHAASLYAEREPIFYDVFIRMDIIMWRWFYEANHNQKKPYWLLELLTKVEKASTEKYAVRLRNKKKILL